MSSGACQTVFNPPTVSAEKSWERTSRGFAVQSLGAGWLIVGVVQTDKRVPQERSELAASLFQLCGRRRGRLEYSCEVGSHLHVGVMLL